jgi:hypothetical protein
MKKEVFENVIVSIYDLVCLCLVDVISKMKDLYKMKNIDMCCFVS